MLQKSKVCWLLQQQHSLLLVSNRDIDITSHWRALWSSWFSNEASTCPFGRHQSSGTVQGFVVFLFSIKDWNAIDTVDGFIFGNVEWMPRFLGSNSWLSCHILQSFIVSAFLLRLIGFLIDINWLINTPFQIFTRW